MNILDDFKKITKNVADKTPQATKDAWAKIKEVGEDGLEYSKEIIDEVGTKFTNVSDLVKLKNEISQDTISLDDAYRELGKVSFTFFKFSKAGDMANFETAENWLDDISKLRKGLQKKTEHYEQIKKRYAGKNHVINDFADELSKSGLVMDQAIVGDKSNVVRKRMKEITLPKQALITSVQRGDEMLVPDGNTEFLAGDKVTVLGEVDHVQKVIKRLSGAK